MTRAKRRLLSIALALALIAPAPPAAADETAADPKALEVASMHYERGVRLFEEGDAKLALVEFERSYAAVPDYRTLFNIGQVQLKLGAFAEARRTLERYLTEGGERVPAARKESVTRNLEALALRTAHLAVSTSVAGAEVRLDGAMLGVTPLAPTLVTSGAHRLTVTKTGFENETIDVPLVGGEERNVSVMMRPLRSDELPRAVDRPRESPSPLVWAAWGTTGVLLAGAVGMTFAWQSASSDLDATKARVTSREELDDKKSTVETRMTIAAALGAATLVAAGAALYITLRPPGKPRATAVITPLGLGGTF